MPGLAEAVAPRREGGEGFATSLDASAQAFWGLSPKLMEQLRGRLLAVLVQRQLAGAVDMSARELRQAYFDSTGVWVDMSSVSSAVHGLVSAGRVQRCGVLRACRESGNDITPLRAVPKQQALV